MIVLGVDPGATSCGLVVRDGDQLLAHTTVTRAKGSCREEWLNNCLDAVEDLIRHINLDWRLDLVAVEDINTPSPHLRQKLIDPTPLIETAMLAGAILAWAWSGPVSTILVPPGHNGQGPILFYPTELQPTRGQGKGHDALRHCRSAWDIAHTGAMIAGGRVVA